MPIPAFIGGGRGNAAAAQTAQAAAAAKQAAQQKALTGYASTAISDINSGNYAGAWDAALQSSTLYNTNYNSVTTDPLLQAMESGTGLQALDPSKKWDAASIQSYYSAMEQNPVYQGKTVSNTVNGQTGNESFGKNPYGLWGSGAAITNGTDVKANLGAAGDNSAPDVQRFAGSRPTQSFLSKYGTSIAMLAAAVAAPELIGALAPELGGTAIGTTIGTDALAGNLAAAVATPTLAGTLGAGALVGAGTTAGLDALTGKPLTAGSVLGGALGGAAGVGLTGAAGNFLNGATGLGSTVSTGLAGAGIGAARSALTGGNVGMGALAGGIGGAVQGSGVAGTLKTGLTNAGINSGVSNALVNGGLNYAVGGLTGLAAGALIGNGQNSSGVGHTGGTAANGSGTSNTGALSGGTGAGTDSSLSSTLTGALPGVLQGAAGVYGSQNAAEKQTQADQNAINTQTSALGNINNIWSTQQNLGQGAQKALGTALGTNGQPADYSGFENMPGYKFAVSQGTQAIQRQAAAMGNAYTPNTAAAVGQYVTGTASQYYNTYISQLMSAAGLGTTANQGLQTANQSTGNNISTLQQNQGYAQASGVSGASNAVGGVFSPNGVGTSLVGAGANWLNNAFGGSGGGSNLYQGSADTGPVTYNGAAGTGAPTFDPNSVSMPTMPSIDLSGYNFDGSLNFGTSSNDMFNGGANYLGGY